MQIPSVPLRARSPPVKKKHRGCREEAYGTPAPLSVGDRFPGPVALGAVFFAPAVPLAAAVCLRVVVLSSEPGTFGASVGGGLSLLRPLPGGSVLFLHSGERPLQM